MRLFTFILLFNYCLLLNAQGWRSRYGVNPEASIFEGYNNLFMFETTPGNYISGITGQPLKIMGLNSQGQIVWNKNYSYGNNYVNMFLANSRHTYVEGNYFFHAATIYDSNVIFGEDTFMVKYKGVLTKLDFNGDTIWQKTYADTSFFSTYIEGYGIRITCVTGSVDGGFLLSGLLVDTIQNACLLIKTDSQGNELWRKEVTDIASTLPYGIELWLKTAQAKK